MRIRAFSDREALRQATADAIAAALQEGISRRGFAVAALSGGATPIGAYEALAERRLDWAKITFALVDERFVAPDHPGSNEGLLRRTLSPALAAGARLSPMFHAGLSLDEAADRADQAYAQMPLDIALMGMGADGHTASWFSDAPQLQFAQSTPRAVAAVHAPGAEVTTERLTLTRSRIAAAAHVLVLITGAEKRKRLEAAVSGASGAPVAALFDGQGAAPEVYWAP